MIGQVPVALLALIGTEYAATDWHRIRSHRAWHCSDRAPINTERLVEPLQAMTLRIQVRLAHRQIRPLPTCRGWRLVTWTCPTPLRYPVGDERRRPLHRPSLACRVPRDWWPAVLEQSGAALSKALCALKAAATSRGLLARPIYGRRSSTGFQKHRETVTAPHDLGASCFSLGSTVRSQHPTPSQSSGSPNAPVRTQGTSPGRR